MSKNLEVEICCGSYYDTLQAWKGGAKRVELNSALHLGGLTPSLGTLRQDKPVLFFHYDILSFESVMRLNLWCYFDRKDWSVTAEALSSPRVR